MTVAQDVLDEIMPSLTPTGSETDDTLARPVEFAALTLYGWPLSEAFNPEGTGEWDDARFSLRLAWAADASEEVASMTRDRDTSLAIGAVVDAIQAWVLAHRTGTAYEQLQVTGVDWDSLVTHELRGAYVDLAGYQLLS
jgi:hypothetical protein